MMLWRAPPPARECHECEALYRRPRTTKPERGHKIYPYLLRGMEVTRPNHVGAMDITYIPMARGFVYLAVVLDWFSRRVLSWRLSITMEAAFCVETLDCHRQARRRAFRQKAVTLASRMHFKLSSFRATLPGGLNSCPRSPGRHPRPIRAFFCWRPQFAASSISIKPFVQCRFVAVIHALTHSIKLNIRQ
jgi:transposase InsO family protein